jgi:hypothetical protein
MADLDQFGGNTTATVSSEKTAHANALKEAMAATLAENGAAYEAERNTRSADIVVTKVLGYTNKGSIVETAKAIGKRGEPGYVPHKVADSAKNVGYAVKNVSANPIEYQGTECQLIDGQYVPTPVQLVIAPGQEAPLRKADLVRLMSAPEFGFVAANGKLRSSGAANANGIEELLNSYTFSFDEGSVLDYQQQIGVQDAEGKWFVADEFKSIFGDEENVKVAATRTRGEGAKKKSTQAYESNYVYRLLAQNNM